MVRDGAKAPPRHEDEAGAENRPHHEERPLGRVSKDGLQGLAAMAREARKGGVLTMRTAFCCYLGGAATTPPVGASASAVLVGFCTGMASARNVSACTALPT